MTKRGRVLTANLPDDLATELDRVSGLTGRSKSWIMRNALAEWMTEEQRRYDLTLEALKSVDAGETISHEEMVARLEQRKLDRRDAARRGADEANAAAT